MQANIRWYTNQPDVIGIDCIFSDAGIEYDQSDSIAVRVKALNPGTAKLFVEFKTPVGILTDAMELTVFKALELESPKRIYSDAIIVPPNSRINLKANLPDAQFHLAEEKNGRLRVSADGILETSEHIGRDLIIVCIESMPNSLRRLSMFDWLLIYVFFFIGNIGRSNTAHTNRNEEHPLHFDHSAAAHIQTEATRNEATVGHKCCVESVTSR